MKFVVQQTSFTANQVGVEVIRLKTIDDRRAFADAAVFEFQEGDAAGGVLVGSEDFAAGFGIVTSDFDNLVAHAEQKGIQGMAAGCQEGAAAGVLARVP